MPRAPAAIHLIAGFLRVLAVAGGLAALPAAAQSEVDLVVGKSAPATAAAGSNVAYTVTLDNFGPDAATVVNVNDAVPAGMTFVSATSPAGFSCVTPAVGAAGAINCGIATFPASASATFTFVMAIPPGTPPGTTFTNVASATTADFDVNSENDAASAFTAVPGATFADAGVTKTAVEVAFADTTVTYTLTLSNAGPDAAASLTLTDTLPGPLTFVSLTASGQPLSCTTPALGAGGTVTCTSASFPVGSATLTLAAHVPAATPLGTSFTNTATVTSASDPNPENDSGSTTLEVVSPATLTLEKAVVNDSGGAAAATAWTLTASGPSIISGARGQAAITAAAVLPGSYALSESGPVGYTATGPYACVVNGVGQPPSNLLTLAQGETAVCTITNDDNAHVAYSGNGNTGGTAPVDATSYPPGSAVTVASAGTLTRTGFTFTGWNTAANGGGSARPAGSSFAIGSVDVTLFAQWAPTFTVTYNGNGSTGGATPTDGNAYPAGATVTVLGNTGALVRAGYTFTGWNTAANGSGSNRPPGSTFAMGAASVALYAQWTTLPTYTVTYSGNGNSGGTPPVDGSAYPAGSSVTVLGNSGALVRAGFAFGGWNTAADGSGTSYMPGATLVIGSANLTLFARWSATSVSGSSPTGGGTITASLASPDAGCGFMSAQFIPLTGHAASPPAGSAPGGVTFPFGLFDFTVGGCLAQGSSITVTVTYPSAIPAGASYWKYGPTPASATPSWYVLPATLSGNTAVFTIVDGGLGDDDRLANGTIVDQGGPGVPGAPAAPEQVPTLSEWAIVLLAWMMLLLGMRRRA